MIDQRLFNPPSDVILARREAILKAARELQTQKEDEKFQELNDIPAAPTHGFPIVLTTTQKVPMR